MGTQREMVRQREREGRATENSGGTRGSSEGWQRGTRRQKAEGPRGDRDKTVGSWASLSLDWTKAGVAGLEGQHGHLVGQGTVLAPWVPLGGPLGRLISTALNALQGPRGLAILQELAR